MFLAGLQTYCVSLRYADVRLDVKKLMCVVALTLSFFDVPFSYADSLSDALSDQIHRASEQIKSDPKGARQLLDDVLTHSKVKQYPRLQTRAHLVLARLDKSLGLYDAAKANALSGLNMAAQTKNMTLRIDLLNEVGDILRRMALYEQAQPYLAEASTLAERLGDKERWFWALDYEGDRLRFSLQQDAAIAIYQRALDLATQLNAADLQSEAYSDLAQSFKKQEDHQASYENNKIALALAENLGDDTRLGMLLEYITTDQRNLGLYTEALATGKRGLALQRKLGDKEREARILIELAIIYRKLSSYDNALQYATELLSIREQQNDLNGIASACNETGLIYSRLEQFDNARHCYEQTLALPVDKIKPKYRAVALREMALLLYQTEHYTEGLAFAHRAIKLYTEIGSVHGASSVNRTLGRIFEALGRTDDALSAYGKALEQARSILNRWSAASALYHIGKIYIASDPERAAKELYNSLSIARELGADSLILECYEALVLAEQARGDFKQALFYSNLSFDKMREISRLETTQRIAELQILRETEQRERELDELRRESQIRDLDLSRQASELEILNQENTIAELEIARARYTTIILLAVAVSVFLALGFLYMRYYFHRSQQRILDEKTREIELKNARLEEMNAAKDRFFSIIAHDLRGPISSLVNVTDTIDEEFDSFSDEALHNTIGAIHSSLNETHKLLDELLEWATIQLRDTDPVPRNHPIDELCQSVIDSLQAISQAKAITVDNKVVERIIVRADKNMVNTVIRNLLANALKFTGKGGHIELYAEIKASQVVVHVRDYGVGMTEKDIAEVFRIDKVKSRKGTSGEEGTGLGLALCKDLIEKNQGEIFVDSVLGEGSDFRFTLPLVRSGRLQAAS